MVFSSHLFLFYFLPLALAVYYALPRRGRHLGLTVLSYVFYGWADLRFVILLFGTTLVDYVAALAIWGTTPWSKEVISPLEVGDVARASNGGRWCSRSFRTSGCSGF